MLFLSLPNPNCRFQVCKPEDSNMLITEAEPDDPPASSLITKGYHRFLSLGNEKIGGFSCKVKVMRYLKC